MSEKKALEKSIKLAIASIEEVESSIDSSDELSGGKTCLNQIIIDRAKDELLRILGVLQIIPVTT